MNTDFHPNCRYGHGDLTRVDEQGQHPKWGFISQSDAQIVFSGRLYACKTCGYLELFDDEIELTLKRQAQP